MKELYSYTQDYTNRWIVSYADFVTMLLALFMVMYALSQININNMRDFSNSVGKVFDKSHKYKTFTDINILEQKRELLKIFSTTKVKINTDNVDISDQKAQIAVLKNNVENINENINREAIEFENIKSLLHEKLSKVNGLYIKRESRGLVISLKDMIIFEPGSDIIKDKAKVTLNELAQVLKQIPNGIRIEGHTDNKPIITSKFPSNWELSTSRATNIVRYLINNYQFSPGKLSAVGYGEYMPVSDNSTAEGRAANRRVNIVILSEASKIFEPESN